MSPPTKCSQCGKLVRKDDPANWKRHLRTHVPKEAREKSHQCPYCDRVFYEKSTLRNHVGRHLHLKAKCPVPGCRRVFAEIRPFRDHVAKAHDVECPDLAVTTCGRCKEVFPSTQALARHSTIHDAQVRYICGLCLKGSSQWRVMAIHWINHVDFDVSAFYF